MATEQSNWGGRALMLAKVYLATAFFLWKFSCYFIAGEAGLAFQFKVSGWGRAVEVGYVLALCFLARRVVKKLKAGQLTGVVADFIFIIVGLAWLLSGIGVALDLVNLVSPLLGLGVNVAMIYFSWRGWRRLDCRGFGYLFFASGINLLLSVGWWVCYQPRRGISANWEERGGQWFWDYYWVGGIVSGVLLAAGAIQIIRTLQSDAGKPAKPVSAGTLVLAFIFLLIGLKPASVYFHSTSFITTLCVNVAVLAVVLRSPRQLKWPAITCWAWATGITLASVAVQQYWVQQTYRPQFGESQPFSADWQMWLACGSVATGCLWLAGLVFAIAAPGIFAPRISATETKSESSSTSVIPGWARKRASALALGGALLVSIMWVRDHDPKELISLEPKHQGHTLTYWLEHWNKDSWPNSVNNEAVAAVQAIGAKAVPLLVKWTGRPYSGFNFSERALKAFEVLGPTAEPAVPKLIAIIGRGDAPQRALLAIGPVAVPSLVKKYLETLTDTNPPDYNWRNPKSATSPAHVRECIVSAWLLMGTNAGAAIPALIQGAGSRQWWTQHSAINALGVIGQSRPDVVLPALTNLLQQADAATTAELAQALGTAGKNRPNAVLPILLNLLHGTNVNATSEAAIASALAEVGHDRPQIIVPVLLSIFEHPHTNAPAEAEQFFYRGYSARRNSSLWFEGGRTSPRARLADALAVFGAAAQPAVPALRLAGREKDPELRAHVSLALLKIAPKTPGALEPLFKNLDERDVQVRREALWTIQSLGTNAVSAIPALVEKSRHDPDREVRGSAMDIIQQMHFINDDLMAAMTENLADTNTETATASARILSQFLESSPQVFPPLLKAFRFCADRETRREIKDSLDHASERDANPLINCLHSEDPQLRLAALQLVDDCGFDFKETRAVLIKAKHDADPAARAIATNMLITACARIIGQAAAEERIHGGNLDATNAQGQTPLHLVIPGVNEWPMYWPENGGPYNSLLLLLQADMNVNIQDANGRTPLHVLASEHNSFEADTTKALLMADANPNLPDRHGRTPTHLFLTGEWPWTDAGKCLGMLADAGANFSAQDDEGKTPLHYLANLKGQNPLFFIRGIDKIFIAAKVDFNVRDHAGNTPLHFAAQAESLDVFDWLVKQGANLDAPNNVGQTPRLLAAKNQSPFARYSTATAAEIDLVTAIRDDRPEAAERILRADARLANTPDQFNQTPLRVAALLHRTNLLTLLEKFDVKWDAASAAMSGRSAVLEKILHDNPSAITNAAYGKSLLHFAADEGDEAIAKMLLTANAKLEPADQCGLSPLGRALLRQHTKVASLLLAQGAKENFFDAVYLGDTSAVAAWLAQDAALAKASNPLKISAVEIAAAAGRDAVLKLLLNHGGAANAPRSPTLPGRMPTELNLRFSGKTPLILATFFNQTAAMEILIAAKAELNQPDGLGFTPLHWAIFRGHAAAADVLLQHKADLNLATALATSRRGAFAPVVHGPADGDTPLHLAVMLGSTNLVQWLLKSGADANAVNGRSLTSLDQAEAAMIIPRSLGLMQGYHALADFMEPLGRSAPMPGWRLQDPEQRKMIASMIEAAGGKHSAIQPSPFGQPRPNFSTPTGNH